MYANVSNQQEQILQKLSKKNRLLSYSRIVLLVTAIYFLYLMMYEKNSTYGFISLALIAVFVVVVNVYLKTQHKIAYHKALKQLNTNEINFLNNTYTFNDGIEYQNPQHAFSYDLDLFGSNSIFQFLNRTNTYLGKEALANAIQEIPVNEKIVSKQEAIQELTHKINFRQHFQTLGLLAGTTATEDLAIKKWSESFTQSPKKIFSIIAIVLPSLFLFSIIGTVFDLHVVFSKLTVFFFTLNLMVIGYFTQFILREIGKSDRITNSLNQYAKMIEVFEKETFQSHYLIDLQNQLRSNQKSATAIVTELANYFEKLNTVANLFVFIALNGTFQYHFWVYKKLLTWKQKHQQDLWKFMTVIGEVEALNSLANFAYNNPEYNYPVIEPKQIKFTDLGHPLLSKNKRVRNDIDFTDKSFVILTGSNMSGKSTFLRTVGINLILSYAGAPIDAKKAVVCSLPLWVSMRLTDSLSDSESFFFAEVKRLKQIVNEAEKQPIFVLLDEILKGTNSDDKKSGTIGVIEKIHNLNVTGIIATHDLEVCKTTENYPESMENKCFEVEIVNDELKFDYKLKNGICQNKNATFIMKKMEII